jgi:hypothetical protein
LRLGRLNVRREHWRGKGESQPKCGKGNLVEARETKPWRGKGESQPKCVKGNLVEARETKHWRGKGESQPKCGKDNHGEMSVAKYGEKTMTVGGYFKLKTSIHFGAWIL